ncbi:hypothetical protein FHR83_001274 [Actinoplanes campanulatus]|uniref:Uncharacterized protein n=1 Tax=Actinoplanes campanulatus TaxID=113559 RepID=A0A7W5FCV2_9ACTN|nr:hypothetical protein [Actinoplanes campanulatus]MBB3093625.1 hypothetical protein [Actinoplanes campanulatus]GGN04583.1 hypothetical protein GCM10010109_11440 [Actinoplanes campanulatus]GID35300.1 hypothetical protein Aca09nite_18060 [Actinoplanes campanulatus]
MLRQHGTESPARFLPLVERDSLKAPETGFRRSDRFAQWRA